MTKIVMFLGGMILCLSIYSIETVHAMPTQPSTNQSLDYLAIGDSFTSGEGDTNDKYYLPGTNQTTSKCHLSKRSYPFLLASWQGFEAKSRSVACSGATIEDVFGYSIYWGQNQRLKLIGVNSSKLAERQSSALTNFTPGETRQINFIYRYKPTAVSVSIGGNDVGLFDKLRACLMPTVCEWTGGDYLTQMGREIRGLFDKLTRLYANIQKISSRDTLYAVGYPQIINPSGFFCDPIINYLLSTAERVLVYQSIAYMNQVIQAAARWAGIPYVSIEDAFNGSRLCDLSPSAMNGLTPGDDMSIMSNNSLLMLGNESFHPTPRGHELIAKVINEAVDLSSPRSGAVSGETWTNSPPPPSYWGDNNRSLPRLVKQSLQVNEMIIGGNMMRIILGPGSFLGGSSISISIHSEEVQLLVAEALSDGSLNLEVKLPDNLMTGFHTIHVTGEDSSGAIDYYQVLNYTQPSVDDEVVLGVVSQKIPTNNYDDLERTHQESIIESGQPDTTSFESENSDHNDFLFWYLIFVLLIFLIMVLVFIFKRYPP